MTDIRPFARIIARLNDHRWCGLITETQWYRLLAAVIGEFR